MVSIIDTSRTYYFLHIPKTAGTTFKAVLQQPFLSSQVCNAENLLELSRSDHSDKRLFMGHYFHGIEKLIGRNPHYITFLRDPVKRFVSHYQNIKRQAHHPFHQYTASLESFIESPVIQEHCANVQTRMIAATINKSLKRHWGKPALLLLREFEKAVKRSDKSKLEVAIKRLNAFEFVGNADKFEESVQQLGLAWSGQHLNSGDYADPERCLTDRISELNNLDIQLVQHILKPETV